MSLAGRARELADRSLLDVHLEVVELDVADFVEVVRVPVVDTEGHEDHEEAERDAGDHVDHHESHEQSKCSVLEVFLDLASVVLSPLYNDFLV